ncbi:hypothetical protein KKA24_00960 [Patescibacteria group bacterium]|nr:hypothetical protein [Patescibacteria group bacterium]
MDNQDNNTITISKETVRQEGGVVILPMREYKELLESRIPTYYLEGKEAEDLDMLVEEGLREHKEGKTIKATSLKDALNIYDRK